MYDALSGGSKPHHHIRFSCGIKSDLKRIGFLNHFNRVAYFPDTVWKDSSILQLFIDSTDPNNLNCGYNSRGSFFCLQLPEHCNN